MLVDDGCNEGHRPANVGRNDMRRSRGHQLELFKEHGVVGAQVGAGAAFNRASEKGGAKRCALTHEEVSGLNFPRVDRHAAYGRLFGGATRSASRIAAPRCGAFRKLRIDSSRYDTAFRKLRIDAACPDCYDKVVEGDGCELCASRVRIGV